MGNSGQPQYARLVPQPPLPPSVPRALRKRRRRSTFSGARGSGLFEGVVRGVVRLDCLHVGRQGQKPPVEPQRAAVGYDLPFIEAGRIAYAGAASFFLSRMPKIAADRMRHASTADSSNGRAG